MKRFFTRKFVSFMLCIVMLSGIISTQTVPVVSASIPENPHYYSTALQEFFKDAIGNTTAVLCDLDGDGVEEVVAYKGVYDYDWGYNFGYWAILDYDNGKGSIQQEYGHGWGGSTINIYISDKNYIIQVNDSLCVDVAPDLTDITGHDYWICKYSNGKITNEMYSISINEYGTNGIRYILNGETITTAQFNEFCNKYGIGKVKKLLWSEDKNAKIDDDNAKILTMTAQITAKPTASNVIVNGENIGFDAYHIDGYNYFKLRDLAYTLNGTAKQFEVSWDEKNNAISLTTGKSYTVVGGEMVRKGTGNKTGNQTTSKIYLDGKEISFTAYNIGGNNYFKLRDILQTFDIYVGWDEKTSTITIDTSKKYVD